MRVLVALLTIVLPSLAMAAGADVEPCGEPPPSPSLGWMGIRFALVCATISFAIKMLRIGVPVWAERGPDGRTTLRSKRLTILTALVIGFGAALGGMLQAPIPGVEWQIVAGLIAVASTLFGHHTVTSTISARLTGRPGLGENTARHQKQNAKVAERALLANADPTETDTFPGLNV